MFALRRRVLWRRRAHFVAHWLVEGRVELIAAGRAAARSNWLGEYAPGMPASLFFSPLLLFFVARASGWWEGGWG